MYKLELKIGSGGSYADYTDELMNWDDVDLSYKRSGLTGVVRSFSTSFQLCGTAFAAMLTEYMSNGVDSVASLRYSLMENDYSYTTLFECALDFSTFTWTHTYCQINAIDNSVAAVLKAKGGTKYQFNVSDLAASSPLYYDHLPMNSFADWLIGGTLSGDGTYSTVTVLGFLDNRMPLYIEKSEVADKRLISLADSSEEFIFYNYADYAMTVQLQFALTVTGSDMTPPSNNAFLVSLGAKGTDATYDTAIYSAALTSSFSDSFSQSVSVPAGYGIRVIIQGGTYAGDYDLYISSSSYFSISLTTRTATDRLDVIKPLTLCNALLRKMTGDNSMTATFTADTRLDKTVILAAESARMLSGAQIYTSWNDFCDYMAAQYGFVPSVSEAGAVSFGHRDTLFDSATQIAALDEPRDVECTVQSDMIIAKVKVGYDKQEYDSVNGRDEWRFGVEYTTGHTLTDNELELVCPYRADAYGIEFLTQKVGEDTTDDTSDEDIFIVHAEEVTLPLRFRLLRAITITGVISPSYMFNAAFSQRYMIAANAKYLASYGLTLSFASMEGNAGVTVGSVAVNADRTVASPLVLPVDVKCTTGDIGIPVSSAGYVTITSGSRTYTGYIRSVAYHVGKSKAVTYTLYGRSLS